MTTTEKTMSSHAAAAKMIRAELKKTFPEVKFSVRAKGYAGGNSVDAYWTDGPRTAEVNAIIDKYQYGHFDGMDDSYHYSNNIEDLPQVKFTFANRSMSPERQLEIVEDLQKRFGVEFSDQKAVWDIFNAYPDEVIYREFNTGFYSE